MPIYEYDCGDCQRQVAVFFRSFADAETKKANCPHCQGTNLKRLISKVTVVDAGKRAARSQAASDHLTRTSTDQADPKALAQTMRQASHVAGQDLGREFKEVAKRLERGESATSIENSLRKRVGENTSPH